MSTLGDWTWFDWAKKKVADGTINLASDTFATVLLGSAQALSDTFVGSSSDCRYADLTAELSTASGYTVGGGTLSGSGLTRISSNNAVGFFGNSTWTLSAIINFKYAVIRKVGGNNDLVAYVDFDVGGTTVAAASGSLIIGAGANGNLGWS